MATLTSLLTKDLMKCLMMHIIGQEQHYFGLLQRKLYFSKDPEGVQHFPVGGGGVQILISIEPHLTCDFRGRGVRTP